MLFVPEFVCVCVCVHIWQLHVSSTSLTDRSSQLATAQKDLELKRSTNETLEDNLQQQRVSCWRFLVLFLILFLIQGDYLSGKPGNIWEFDSCQRNVRDFTKSQGISHCLESGHPVIMELLCLLCWAKELVVFIHTLMYFQVCCWCCNSARVRASIYFTSCCPVFLEDSFIFFCIFL